VTECNGNITSTMVYCKHFCKCHNVPLYNNNKYIHIYVLEVVTI
jgi:hypothetical protein